jgi:hypothetical protein
MVKLTESDVNSVRKPFRIISAIIAFLVALSLFMYILLGFPGGWGASVVCIPFLTFMLWITLKVAISGYPPAWLLWTSSEKE